MLTVLLAHHKYNVDCHGMTYTLKNPLRICLSRAARDSGIRGSLRYPTLRKPPKRSLTHPHIKLHEQEEFDDCVEALRELLAEYAISRYHRIRYLTMLAYTLEDWHAG